MKEKRVDSRVAVRIPAGIYYKDNGKDIVADGEILNLSLGGAFVHVNQPIEVGREVLVEIRFGETRFIAAKVFSGDRMPAPSVVRWERGAPVVGFGVAFKELKPDAMQFIEQVIGYFQELDRAGVKFDPE